MHIYVPGKGNPNAKILILGEAPSYEEETALTPFVGPSGRFLDSALRDVGINRGECWITNACKFMVPPNLKDGRQVPFLKRAKEAGIDIDKQLNELRTEISAIQPNIIVALGGSALWAISGKSPITKWRGSIINAMGFKTIATYHPAHILHQDGEVKGYWNKAVMMLDMKRALQQSHFRDIRPPVRNLHVIKSSAELYDFIQRNANASEPAIDIEARKCIPICIGIAFTPHEGITVPLWNIDGISDIPTPDLVNIWRMLAEFLAEQDIVGQNFGYDRDKIRRLGFIVRSLHDDTMLKAFAINPELPKNLAFLTSVYTEEPYYKDEGMYEGEIHDLLIGCARDACVTKEVNNKLQVDIDEMHLDKYYRNFLLPLHDLYSYNENLDAIEQMGFRVDEEVRAILIRKYIEWDEQIRYDLFRITEMYVNSNSPKQVSEILYDKLNIPERKGTGEEVLTQLLNNTVKNPLHKKVIELILEDRRVKKTLSSYLYSPTDYDGRMRTSYYLCLETGRSATQQQEPPIRPSIEYKEGSVKKKQSMGMAFQTITKHGDIGADIRTMLIPDDGCIFLQADSSQAEARVVALLADDPEMLRLYDEHDIHALTASWFFGGKEEDYSKKILGYEKPERFAGKTLRHAGNLGAGKRRASIELNTQARKYKIAFSISELFADKALRTFHELSPNIRKVFHADVIKCLEKNRRLIAPVPTGIDADAGGTRIFFERWGEDLFRQAYAYIPQRTVSENTKAAALRIRKRASWIKILVESHDALLVQVPMEKKDIAAGILKEEFEKPINFSKCSLPRGIITIPCDIEEGMNYKDLSKFKWMAV